MATSLFKSAVDLEREHLLQDAVGVAQAKQASAAQDLKARIQSTQNELLALPTPLPRWLQRKKQDLDSLLANLREQLRKNELGKAELREQAELIQKRYQVSSATKMASKLVSASVHSAAKTYRKSNIVLMTPENHEEALRQHLRAELGLQETPLMLTAGDVCDQCGIQMTVVSNDSMLSCPSCHKLRILPNSMSGSALHGTDVEGSASITKHRLPEWIALAQGKDYGSPPDDITDAVAEFLIENQMTGLEPFQDEIAEERAANGPFRGVEDAVQRLKTIPELESRLLAISSTSVRTALRGLANAGKGDKFRKYYERSAKVCALVSGYWPPRMTGRQEETLRLLYTVAAPEYEKRRKPKQTYWPGGFPFFLRCLCVLLGWDEFAAQFPIPSSFKEGSSRDFLRNEIWNELGWELVPYSGKLPPMQLPDGSISSLTLEEDGANGDEDQTAKTEARAVRKEVEAKITLKKRKRIDFELNCN